MQKSLKWILTIRIIDAGGFCAESGITVIGQSERTHFQAVDSEASTAPRWRPSVDNVAPFRIFIATLG